LLEPGDKTARHPQRDAGPTWFHPHSERQAWRSLDGPLSEATGTQYFRDAGWWILLTGGIGEEARDPDFTVPGLSGAAMPRRRVPIDAVFT
jgi:hypothetical protein